MDFFPLTNDNVGIFIDLCLRLFDYLTVYRHLSLFDVFLYLASGAYIIIT